MRNRISQPALLENLGGSHMPPVALSVAAQYQFCVDAGVAAAVGFFDDLTAMGLHDHIAMSLHAFMRAARAGLVVPDDFSSLSAQGCTDAFAAGYLGRIQQELRLFHGEVRSKVKRDAAGPPDPTAMH